jgi:outer membrane protein insertion porin family
MSRPTWIALALVLGAAAPARAESGSAGPAVPPDRAIDLTVSGLGCHGHDAPPVARPGFAPKVFIETIVVRGNTATAERLIRRALAVEAGACLSTDDARLREARYKVLALGYFREVELRFEKGSARGSVVLVVDVIERGTVVLNRLFFGTSRVSPWWAGLDLGDRNVGGLGLGVSGAFVFAGEGEAAGARAQRAFALRVEDSAVFGGELGWHAALHRIEASEPYRVSGDVGSSSATHFAAFDYRRTGGRAGVTINLTPLARLTVDGRYESVLATLPAAPTRELPGGGREAIDLHLEDGRSRVATVAIGLDRDSRPDPVLPYAGTRVAVQVEAGAEPLSSYAFTSLLGRVERWHQLAERHVLSIHLTGGAVLGDAPRFDRLYVGELDRMLSPRALGLVVSTASSLDVFGTGADQLTYGELGGVAEVQYAFRWFRGKGRIYGGDLFVGAGLWTLAEKTRLAEASLGDSLSIDLLLDAGLRLDTELGIFELSLANGLGRLPL